jgi:iron complex outermembrane recepter protein
VVSKKVSSPSGKHDGGRHFDSTNLARAVRCALRPSFSALAAGTLGTLGALGVMASAHAQQATGADSNPTAAQSSLDLTEIVVTARRAALQNADERKKNSESMIDSVVADESGLLPDNSVTEVLQRVAGVTMVRFAAISDPDHFSVEGSGIQVRGLSGVAARLNGRDVFSATGGQGLSFGDVTPELLAAVDVYKSATADLIEGGSGGQVDLRTRMPFDFDPGLKFSTTATGQYGDLAKKADPGASFLLSDRWEGPWGEFGALVDIAYSKLEQKDFFIRNEEYYKQNLGGTDYYIPGGFDYGFDQSERTRTGEYVALQWAPTDSLQVAETFFFSKYKTKGMGDGVFVTSQQLVVDPSASKFDANKGLISSPALMTRDSGTFSTAVGVAPSMGGSGDAYSSQGVSDTLDSSTTIHWKPAEHWDLKAAFQYVDSVSDTQSYNLFDAPPQGNGYGLTETSSEPVITMPASTLAAYQNASNYFWNAHMDHRDHHDGEEHAGTLDLKYDISDSGFFRSAQVGSRYADRTEQDADNGYNWSPFCEGWNGCARASLGSAPTVPGNIALQPFSNFFRGAINNPAGGGIWVASYNLANTYNVIGNVNQFAPGCNTSSPANNPSAVQNGCITGITNAAHTAFLTPPNNFFPEDYAHERSSGTALYGLVRFANDNVVRFDGNFGVRLVKIDNKSQGYFLQNPVIYPAATSGGTGTILFPSEYYYRTGGRDTSRALPALNIRFKPTDQFFIRAAYTVTLDEPSFNDARANGSDGASFTTATVGGVQTVTSTTYNNTSGNPSLRPTISHNTDLEFEWYPSASTSAHLSLFYKKLNDTVVYGNTLQPVPFETASGSFVTEEAAVQADYNAAQAATVKGAEIGGRTFFDMLPSPFNGLGVEGNYTHINDNNPGNQYEDINGVVHHDTPIVGLSNNSYNAAFMFEKPMVSLRLAYNWRSKWLMTTNANGTNMTYTYYSAPGVGTSIGTALPVYAADYGQLDLGAAFRPNKHFTISVDVSNLTNAVTKTLMGGYANGAMYTRSWFVGDRGYLLSFRYTL